MANKKTKEPSAEEIALNQKKAEALNKIVEHNRDYLKVDLTLPLGDKCLKKVHTNQWLFTDLPKQFDLTNWTILAQALNANTNRYEGYVENRWYIESNDISVDVASGKAEMKLGLNAFASSYATYADAYKSFERAYNQDSSSSSSTSTSGSGNKTSASKNTTNAVTSGKNTTIKSGWWGTWMENFVRETVGSETDTLKKCKMLYNKFREHMFYKRYCCACKTRNHSYEKAWKDAHLNCGDGANFQSAMYNCAGAEATCMSTDFHFIVRIRINGQTYWTDQSGAEGAHNTRRGWNQVFGYKGGSEVGKQVTCECYSC